GHDTELTLFGLEYDDYTVLFEMDRTIRCYYIQCNFIHLLTSPILNFYTHVACFIKHIRNTADKTEGIFRDIVIFAIKNVPEVRTCLRNRHICTFLSRKLLCDVAVL